MNELQAKLARRRNLNGEGGGEVKSNAPEVPSASPSGTPNTTVRKSVTPSAAASSSTAPKTTKSFIPNDKPSSGQTELQLKLARRANLNGEPQVARRMSNADPLPPSEADHKSESTPPTSANSSVQDPAGLMTATRSQSNETTLSEVTNLTEELNQAERHATEAAAAAFESEKLRALEEERVNAERAAADAAATLEAEQEESERRRAAEAEEQQRQAAEAAAAAWAESERLRCLEENLRAAAAEAEAAEQERRRIAEEAAAAEEARIAAAVQQAAEEERARAAALAAEEAERHRQAAEMAAAQERQRLAAAAEQAERERVAAAEAAAAAAAVEAEEAAAAKKRREKEEAELAAASAAAALAEEERVKAAAAAAKRKQEEEAAAAAAAAKEAEEADKRRKQAEAEAAQQAAAAAAAAEKAAKEQANAELRVFQQLWAAETKAAEEEANRKERERTTSKDKEAAAAGAATTPLGAAASSGATTAATSTAPTTGAVAPAIAPTATPSAAAEKGRATSPMVNRQNTSGSTTSSSSSSGAAAESGAHTPTSAAQSRRAISTPGPTGSHEKWYPGKYLLGSRARATPIAMNPLTAQSHYKELLSTAGDTPMSPPSTPHKTAALTSASTSGGIGGVAVGPGAVGTPLVSDSHSTVSGGYSGVKSPSVAVAAGGAGSRKEPEGALDFGLTAAAADGGVTPGSVGSGGGESEHVILNNREIEALLAENSRLTALVKKLQAELDLKQAVIDAYEVTYAADPTTPGGGGPSLAASAAAAIKAAAAATPSKHSVGGPSAGTGTPLVAPLTAPPPAPTAGSAAGLAIAAAAAAGAAAATAVPAPTAKQKSYKRHGFRSNYAGAEGDDDDSSGGLFEEEVGGGGSGAASRQFLQSKRNFEGLIADDEAPAGEGATAVPAEVDFDALMDTLSPHTSGAVHNHSSSSSSGGSGGGSSSGGKYNPLQLASQADLVRSFVQGPARPSGGISEASMKERLEGHGLFGANHSSATASDGSGHPTATGAATAAGATTGGKGLFKEDATPAKPKPVEADLEMTYSEFISRFPKCLELVDMARRFLFSVIGPNGDGTPPPNRKKVDYIFYGTQKLDERCRDFFDEMQRKFAAHPEFKHESEERILSARDCFEQYIMTRIAEFAFKSSEAREDDDRLARRMRLLSFLTPEALEIKPELFNETLLAIAADELRKINAFKTPGEKVACVVKSAGVIFRSLNLSRAKQDADKVAAANAAAASGSNANGDSNSTAAVSSSSSASENTPAGADDFLPLFIWVVMRSHIPKLFSNCEYIQAYLNPARLMGKSGYCLINLRSAIEFVMYIEAESLHIDAKEFDTKLAAAEKELNGGF